MALPLFDHCIEDEKARSLGCSSYKQFSSSYSSLKPGHCPECDLKFRNPVALPCGHSLCQVCCDELLQKCNKDMVTVGRRDSRRQATIRMGMGAFDYRPKRRKSAKLQKSLSIIEESENVEKCTFYLSPQCPVCLSRPRFQAPIKNFALEKLIEAWERYKNTSTKNYRSSSQSRKLPSPAPSSTSSSGFDEAEDHYQASEGSVPDVDYSIRKCNIAILGAAGVGKSRLVRAQHLNNLFFGKIGSSSSETDSNGDNINSVTELQAKYMIEILDNNDIDGDLEDADGIVLAYSCTNHESFVRAFNIYEQQIKQREMSHLPLILVATKCDIDPSRRAIKPDEAESLARHIGCPHMEISARKNIGVNEVFAELVKQIESKSEVTLIESV